MNITASQTGETIRIRPDNVVTGPEGSILVDAMFSGLIDLTAPGANIAARLHPAKARAYEWIISGQHPSVVPTGHQEGGSSLTAGLPLNVIPDVQISVNKPGGGTQVRHFSEFLERSRQLLEHGADDDVRSTSTLMGFDPEAEPILREMRDGTLVLVFAFIPPLVVDRDRVKAKRFDLNKFGDEVAAAAGVPIIWDDREVFVVQKPNDTTVERMRQFIANYWQCSKKPLWRFW